MTIGLTYTGSQEKHKNYFNWLVGVEPGIRVITLAADGAADAIGQCDALVLSGGIDVDPRFYQGAEEYPGQPEEWNAERDRYEKSVLEYALANRMPVLGICRGLQLINVHLQGSLVQDLGVEGDATHEAVGDTDKWHSVVVEPGTLLAGIAVQMGDGGEAAAVRAADNQAGWMGKTNSAHHQAIGRLGQGLRVNCRAADGTIEGIEWQEPDGKSFLLGVQWHPERMGDAENPLTASLRREWLRQIEIRNNIT